MTESIQGKYQSTLTDLPPELWGHITTYLPTASSVGSLCRTSKTLQAFVEKDGWKIFSRTRFPSLYPTDAHQYTETARTLSSLSRAWDRRAFIAHELKVDGEIWSFPGRKNAERWRAPKGQTIGFAPKLDAYEDTESHWRDKEETLAFSAGAQLCVRQTRRRGNARWTTYRPTSAYEGRDDITTLHLLKPYDIPQKGGLRLVAGTANGDLRLINLPDPDSADVEVVTSSFETQALPVRSGSLFQQPGQPRLLAASLGDANISLYPVDDQHETIKPLSEMDIHPPLRDDGNPFRSHRVWSTMFLSSTSLAVGTGGSNESIHIYSMTPSGLSRPPLRKYCLQTSTPDLTAPVGRSSPQASSIYSIAPLPDSSVPGQLFLSGSYNGIIRLHDLRSPSPCVETYVDPAEDDSAIYSLLPRGREKFLAGTGRHNLVKVFDLRLGSKCYNYLDVSGSMSQATPPDSAEDPADAENFNLFLRDHTKHSTSDLNPQSSHNNSNSNRNSRNRHNPRPAPRRIQESSVYSLTSPSASSPCIYAGIENSVISIALTEMLDPNPDVTFFSPGEFTHGDESHGRVKKDTTSTAGAGDGGSDDGGSREVLNLAMYDREAKTGRMRLRVQRRVKEMRGLKWGGRDEEGGEGEEREGVDERWREG